MLLLSTPVRSLALGAVGLCILLSCTDEAAEIDPKNAVTASSPSDLRALYFARRYRHCYEMGSDRVGGFPGDEQDRAWFALCASRIGEYQAAEVAAAAAQKGRPNGPWTRFAVAAAGLWNEGNGPAVLSETQRLIDEGYDSPDFLWLRAESLRLKGDKQAAISFLEEYPESLAHSAQLLVVKGAAQFDLVLAEPTKTIPMAPALQTFAAARLLDTESVQAHFSPGWFLLQSQRFEQACPLLDAAADLTPAVAVHGYYFSCVIEQPNVSEAERADALNRGVARLRSATDDSAEALLTISQIYRRVGRGEEAAQFERRSIERAPDSAPADAAKFAQLQRQQASFANTGTTSGPEVDRYRGQLREFLKGHPQLIRHRTSANQMLLRSLVDDASADDDEIVRVARHLAGEKSVSISFVHAQTPIALVDRGVHFEAARDLVSQGMQKVAEAAAYSQRGALRVDKTQKSVVRRARAQRSYQWNMAALTDASGWIHFRGGDIDAATRELIAAHRFVPERGQTLLHLVTLYASVSAVDEATTWAGRCIAARVEEAEDCQATLDAAFRSPDPNRSEDMKWRETLAEKVAQFRSGLPGPEDVVEDATVAPSFALRSLAGDVVSVESLRGKVVLINFWGTWCGVCEVELPLLQSLAERYARVDDVEILTVNFGDPNPDHVRRWLQHRDIDVPVLIDDDYATDAGIFAAPVTWILDRRGNLVYENVGMPPSVVEKLSDHIEAARRIDR